MVYAVTPIEATANLGDQAYEKIRQAIVSGEFASGDVLSDRTLGEALGVSRTPVREAIHRLEAGGLVESRGRSGWRVTTFTAQDVRELFQLRRLLEPAGIDALAGYINGGRGELAQPRLAALIATFDDYDSTVPVNGYREYFERDHTFHQSIVQCTDNRRMVSIYGQLSNHINRGRYFLTLSAMGRADGTLAEHRAVTDALAGGEFAQARAALVEHLNIGERLMLEQLRKKEAL